MKKNILRKIKLIYPLLEAVKCSSQNLNSDSLDSQAAKKLWNLI